jgi:hypothetical protein
MQMSVNGMNKSTDFGFGTTSPSKTTFRGSELRGLQAFGWYGDARKTVTVRHRIVDHRTLNRPRRDT